MFDPRYSMLPQNDTNNQMQSFNNMQSQQPMQNGLISQIMPQQMPVNTNESSVYPYEDQQMPNQPGYARGGEIKKTKRKSNSQKDDNLYPLLAQLVQSQGNNEDSILAHINPLEAQILGLINGNGGSVNPKTGLPQFSFLTKPGKALKNTFKNPKRLLADTVGAGGAALGAMTGNPLIGGAIGGGLRSVIRGKGENPLIGALKGGAYGMGVNGIGQGLTALGSTSVGPALSGQGSLGAYNLSNMGNSAFGVAPNARDVFQTAEANGIGGNALLNAIQSKQKVGVSAGDSISGKTGMPKGFMEKATDYLTTPEGLVGAGSLALQGYGMYSGNKLNEKMYKESLKEKDPAYIAAKEKALMKNRRLSPAEWDELIADEELAETKKMEKEERKNKNSGASGSQSKPVYRKQHSPAEAKATGKWFSYYDNPNFHGAPLYATGGKVSPLIEMITRQKPHMEFEVEEIEPKGRGYYLEGGTGGQDDKIPAYLSDGEYVIDASTVADLGDGNNKAGAMKLDQMVKNVRKHKGGSINLPPKAKSLIDYMR